MKTLNFDFTSLFLYAIILSSLVALVYCAGALVVMLIGINIVSMLIVLFALVGAIMVVVHLIKHY